MIGLVAPKKPAERSRGVWDYVSASRLSLWAKCPLAFRLRYLDGIKTPVGANLFIGRQVHRGLEQYYRHRQLQLTLSAEDVVQRINDAWDADRESENVVFKNSSEEDKSKLMVESLVRAYLDQIPDDEPRPLAVEATLEMPLIDPVSGEDLGINMLGIVDLVLDGPRGPVIVDFKTAARGGALQPIIHEVQLTTYAYLFRRLTGKAEQELQIRRLVKTKVPKIEQHTFAAREAIHLRRLFALVRSYLGDLHAGQFTYRPGMACGMCDFRHEHCRAWCP